MQEYLFIGRLWLIAHLVAAQSKTHTIIRVRVAFHIAIRSRVCQVRHAGGTRLIRTRTRIYARRSSHLLLRKWRSWQRDHEEGPTRQSICTAHIPHPLYMQPAHTMYPE